ncbi:PREDICTED: eukaryotic peptide chain release factor GTP-binding subunit-like [Nicotiana attenuata]|uniref:eukaryotic peptide chain release factor GTP-binding subunit-like n=1 Tax=Nicotiana attenuata TaxID=49451 RepID=UPI0009057E7E|nr:PREDICTED: eukaryotic peptide chain release factor GTP-binding subunit-like [Nicotiana attenuata]
MFMESQTKKVNVVEDVQDISYEAFEEANYINNPQGGYQRQQYQGQGQQNQWRPNPQGQGHQQWRHDQGGSNQGNWNNNNNFSNRSTNPYVPPKGQYSNQGSSSESKLEGMLGQVLQNQEKSDTSMRNMTELVGSHTTSIQKLEMQMRDLSREQNPKKTGNTP